MSGKLFRHGPHHEAQKSTTTTFPLRVFGTFPSRGKFESSGNESPTFSVPSAEAQSSPAVKANIIMRVNPTRVRFAIIAPLLSYFFVVGLHFKHEISEQQ